MIQGILPADPSEPIQIREPGALKEVIFSPSKRSDFNAVTGGQE